MAEPIIKVTSEGQEARTVRLQPGRKYVIGRLETCDIDIDDGMLSRRHCELTATARGGFLHDLGSQNGTYLNGARISDEILLAGDTIQIGRTRIQFVSGDGEASPQRPTRPLPRTPFREELPPRMDLLPCHQCGGELTNHDLLNQMAFEAEGGYFCLSCFCEGAGDFVTLGRYRLARKVGSGGMATVYLAIHLPLRKPVALKVFKEREGLEEKSLLRFLREGRTGARLVHPNIVQFTDAGVHDGHHFISMEFIDGLDTRQRLYRVGYFPVSSALHIAMQVADGLHYAHEQGAIHRDLKPENIIIDREGTAKLTDFGLAKFLDELGSTTITETGAWLGTLSYTPPEQIADSSRVDRRSDIYSLTATLFEWLSGELPFPSTLSRETIYRIKNEPPPIDRIEAQALPVPLIEILRKGMAKGPDQRFQTAAELGEAVAGCLERLQQGG